MTDEPKTGEIQEMTDDDYMAFTQRTRKAFVHHLMEGGEFPRDPKDRGQLLTALADMDRTALGRKRISADEEMANKNGEVFEVYNRLLTQLNHQNPLKGNRGNVIPELDHHQLGHHELEPGETDVGVIVEDYDTVMKDD